MADSSAKKKHLTTETEAAAGQTAQELSDIRQVEAKLHQQLGKLKAQARFGAGSVRRQLRQLETEESALSKNEEDATPKTSTDAADSDNNIVTTNDFGISSYVGKSQLDICNEIVQALANGEGVNIPASEMPRANIPQEARPALAELWAEDIQRLEANLPLRAPTSLSNAAAHHAPAIELPQAIPDAQKYQARQGIVDFLENGWPGSYIKAGILSRPELRHLDPDADMALRNWLRKNELPEHLRMPSRTEVAQQMADDPEGVRQAWRVVAAHARRQGPQRE